MAKKSSIEKNDRRKRMTKNAAPKRAKLKAIIADKKRPMTVEDLFRFKRVSDPQISPDGTKVAYVRRTGDVMTDTMRSRRCFSDWNDTVSMAARRSPSISSWSTFDTQNAKSFGGSGDKC